MKLARSLFAALILVMAVLSISFAAGCNSNDKSCSVQLSAPADNTLSGEEQAAGWKLIFDGKTMDGWSCTNTLCTAWHIVDGTLYYDRSDNGYLYTNDQYGDYELKIDFMVDHGSNSGIFFRWANISDPVQTGIEMQVLDSAGKEIPGKHDCGAVYDVLAPSENAMKPAYEWNTVTIKCRKNFINITMNGKRIIALDLDKYTEPHKNIDGTGNKFSAAYKDMPRKGHIGLQSHGGKVWYKNVKIRELN